MTDAVDFRTFDVAEMFSGASYPTEVVDFYTDSSVAYEFHKLTEQSLEAIKKQDDELAKDIEKRHAELVKKAKDSHYKVHLRGQSRDNIMAIIAKVDEEFPVEYTFIGQEKPNAARNEKLTNLFWQLYIEKIDHPNGSVMVSPPEEVIKIIRGQAPISESEKVDEAIKNLRDGVKSGFESLAQENDFLSSPSSEG